MSLVGNFDDLGLAEIMQIVSLSRKSGLLVLRSDSREGRIVFREGLVCGAFAKGEPEDLKGLLVGGGFLSDDEFERAALRARESKGSLDDALSEHTDLTPERLASLRREQVERSVIRMFGWRSGEFCFEAGSKTDDHRHELMVLDGVNPQFLAMEATRLGDEGNREKDVENRPVGAACDTADSGSIDALAPADAESAESDPPETVAEQEAPTPSESPRPGNPAAGLIVIDAELAALEWLKSALGGLFPRIHIFQHCESGVTRIRQYLGRAEFPVVLVASTAHRDPNSGARCIAELVGRLRAQASNLPILVMHDDTQDPPDAGSADAVVVRPSVVGPASRELESAAEALRQQLEPWAQRPTRPR
ncbi:MAG: DUF4388 domain-containing protein [Myxococcota bacterium]